MNFFRTIKRVIENRQGKLRRMAALTEQRPEVAEPFLVTLEAKRADKKLLEDTLAGVFVTEAEKKLQRALAPIDAEIRELRAELLQSPPDVVEAFLDECDMKQKQILELTNARPEIVKGSAVGGDWTERTLVDHDSAMRCIDALRKKRIAASDLILADLTAKELERQVNELRAAPLPQIKRRTQSREGHGADVVETVA